MQHAWRRSADRIGGGPLHAEALWELQSYSFPCGMNALAEQAALSAQADVKRLQVLEEQLSAARKENEVGTD